MIVPRIRILGSVLHAVACLMVFAQPALAQHAEPSRFSVVVEGASSSTSLDEGLMRSDDQFNFIGFVVGGALGAFAGSFVGYHIDYQLRLSEGDSPGLLGRVIGLVVGGVAGAIVGGEMEF